MTEALKTALGTVDDRPRRSSYQKKLWRKNESTGRRFPAGVIRIDTSPPPGIDELPPPEVEGPLSKEPPDSKAVTPTQLVRSRERPWVSGIESSQPRGDRDLDGEENDTE